MWVAQWQYFHRWRSLHFCTLFIQGLVALIIPLHSLLREFSLTHTHGLPDYQRYVCFYFEASFLRSCSWVQGAYCSASVWLEVVLKPPVPVPACTLCIYFIFLCGTWKWFQSVLFRLLLATYSPLLLCYISSPQSCLCCQEGSSWLSIPMFFLLNFWLLYCLTHCCQNLVAIGILIALYQDHHCFQQHPRHRIHHVLFQIRSLSSVRTIVVCLSIPDWSSMPLNKSSECSLLQEWHFCSMTIIRHWGRMVAPILLGLTLLAWDS